MLELMDDARGILGMMPSEAYRNGIRDRETLEWLEDFRLHSLQALMPIHKATWLRLYRLPMDLSVSSFGDETRSFNYYVNP